MSTLKLLTILNICLLLHYVNSLHQEHSLKSQHRRIHRKGYSVMLVPDSDPNGIKKRIISPNDIASLFNTNNNRIKPSNFREEEDDDDDNEDINDFSDDNDDDDDDSNNKNKNSNKNSRNDNEDSNNNNYKASMNTSGKQTITTDSKRDNSSAWKEMELLESMTMTSSENLKLSGESMVNTNMNTEDNIDEFDYTNLNKVLDKSSRSSVLNALSMTSSSSSSTRRVSASKTNQIGPRTVKYDPSDREIRDDPMRYGAYRRWKVVEQSPKKLRGKSSKNKRSKTSAERFYDAIKNFGSGPSGEGLKPGTGMAEPPPNKGPIQPKKAPIKKNKKRIITPEDIDNLFAKNDGESELKSKNSVVKNSMFPSSSPTTSRVIELNDSEMDVDDYKSEDNEQDDEEEEGNYNDRNYNNNDSEDYDEDEDNWNQADKNQKDKVSIYKKNVISNSNNNPFFNPMAEEIPKWLDDANKEQKRERMLAKKGKKAKKLFDDWKFWAAIIATFGFASAFYTVSQQSGVSFNGFGFPPNGGGGGSELVI